MKILLLSVGVIWVLGWGYYFFKKDKLKGIVTILYPVITACLYVLGEKYDYNGIFYAVIFTIFYFLGIIIWKLKSKKK